MLLKGKKKVKCGHRKISLIETGISFQTGEKKKKKKVKE